MNESIYRTFVSSKCQQIGSFCAKLSLVSSPLYLFPTSLYSSDHTHRPQAFFETLSSSQLSSRGQVGLGLTLVYSQICRQGLYLAVPDGLTNYRQGRGES